MSFLRDVGLDRSGAHIWFFPFQATRCPHECEQEQQEPTERHSARLA